MVATATSSVLLNGTKGRMFKHRTGLRQGNTLSPMLFILALESLQNLLEKAARLKNPLHAIQWHTMDELYFSMALREFTLRISLYANDEAVFVNH